jgi:hypothetical protein
LKVWKGNDPGPNSPGKNMTIDLNNEATLSSIFNAALIEATEGVEAELHGANFGVLVDTDDPDHIVLAHFIVRDDGSVMAW